VGFCSKLLKAVIRIKEINGEEKICKY
jgi:hypothetical protein